jgi:hypothetical protein
MDKEVYGASVALGTIGLIIILVIIFFDEIYKTLKGIWEWLVYDVAGYNRFQVLTTWDWVWVIIIIVSCTIYCIVRIFSKD